MLPRDQWIDNRGEKQDVGKMVKKCEGEMGKMHGKKSHGDRMAAVKETDGIIDLPNFMNFA